MPLHRLSTLTGSKLIHAHYYIKFIFNPNDYTSRVVELGTNFFSKMKELKSFSTNCSMTAFSS